LVRRDPFEDAALLSWPEAGASARSLWEPIPLGVDEDGEPVRIGLVAREPVAERLVGPDGREAIGLLCEVQREMDARYRELLARGLRKVPHDDGLPLHLVVVDELVFYLTLPDTSGHARRMWDPVPRRGSWRTHFRVRAQMETDDPDVDAI
jgi:hypothetical protein